MGKNRMERVYTESTSIVGLTGEIEAWPGNDVDWKGER